MPINFRKIWPFKLRNSLIMSILLFVAILVLIGISCYCLGWPESKSGRTFLILVVLLICVLPVILAIINLILYGADASSGFTVKGSVNNTKGKPVKNQSLIAYKVNVRAAGGYNTVSTKTQIQSYGGFVLLDVAKSDLNGNYSVQLFKNQLLSDGRMKADIVVYAFNPNGDISGRSAMVNSEAYADLGEARNIDITITKADDRTEYEILMGKLLPFLQANRLSLIDISGEQLIFISGELQEQPSVIEVAAEAEFLKNGPGGNAGLSHELLYGIGRQSIALNWVQFYKKTNRELATAIDRSVNEKIIKPYDPNSIDLFFGYVHDCACAYILQYLGPDQAATLDQMLYPPLRAAAERQAFVSAYRNFHNKVPVADDLVYSEFWDSFLPGISPFSQQPELITALLLNQQLTIITGNYLPMITELQVTRNISSVHDLVDYTDSQWTAIINGTGVPLFITGKNQPDKIASYANYIQSMLNKAYPTRKIDIMLGNDPDLIGNADVTTDIRNFLRDNPTFDFSYSRIHEFNDQIGTASPLHAKQVRLELNRIQRVFQVSPTPTAMAVLMKANLNSAYSIAGISKKNFISMHGTALGGEDMAEAVYQRADHLSKLAAERAMKLYGLTNEPAPRLAYSDDDKKEVMAIITGEASPAVADAASPLMADESAPLPIIPNYSELFGSPDICECEHCRSVYSPSSYFVELMRFLSKSNKNGNNESPLDKFEARRPDLRHLPLTCENANTVIPYIDLVNEVMEYYTVNNALGRNAAYDTGNTTAVELRANPQNFQLEAYRKLKGAVYPFSLPYHQPLDVIRTYSDHLKTERYEVMKAMQKDFNSKTIKAVEAEALRISEEEYRVLTLQDFNGSPTIIEDSGTYQYFGYENSGDLEKMAGTGVVDGIHEFLRRSGIKYTELVELMKTKFINPYQDKLEYLEVSFLYSNIPSSIIYNGLKQIFTNNSNGNDAVAVKNALSGSITEAELIGWVRDNFSHFQEVITLYQSASLCDLNTTYLRTVHNVYEIVNSSGITTSTWSKIHRFIRLWRKLGWEMHEVDLMLAALGEIDITSGTISKLSSVSLLNQQLKLPLNKLATLWGRIDTYGTQSLYKKLFLNKAVQRVDPIFQADRLGKFLSDASQTLHQHIPAILAAFRISEQDLQAIIGIATIVENGVFRPITLLSDKLNIENLSIIYRYAVMSKAVNLAIPVFCKLCHLLVGYQKTEVETVTNLTLILGSNAPKIAYISATGTLSCVGTMNEAEKTSLKNLNTNTTFQADVDKLFIQSNSYPFGIPGDTVRFCNLVSSVKIAGFKAETLEYIFKGAVSAESTGVLDIDKAKQAAATIHKEFKLIEQNYPAKPPVPLTADILKNSLLLTFKEEVINELIDIVGVKQSFSVSEVPRLSVSFRNVDGSKYRYSATGILTCWGIMTDGERRLIEDSQNFSVTTTGGYTVIIPASLSTKYSFSSSRNLGSISCTGIMTGDEKNQLIHENLGNPDDFIISLDRLEALTGKFKNSIELLFNSSNAYNKTAKSYSVIINRNLSLTIADWISPKLTYIPSTGKLAWKGIMSQAEFDWLNTIREDSFNSGIQALYKMPENFINANFSNVFASSNSNPSTNVLLYLLNRNLQTEKTTDEKLQFVYENYLPLLKKKLLEVAFLQQFAILAGLTEEITAELIKKDNLAFNALTKSNALEGFSAAYFANDTFAGSPALSRTDKQVNFDWKTAAPVSSFPVDNFSVRWKSFITPPLSGDYTLIVAVKGSDESFELWLDDASILKKSEGNTTTSWTTTVALNVSQMYKLELKYIERTGNAGISLSWKTATTAVEIVPSSCAYPADIMADFIATAQIHHRAASFISGFALTTKEVNHFIKYKIDFDNIDFKAINPTHWKRINDYTQLRNAAPQSQALLTDVFEATNIVNPPPVLVSGSQTDSSLTNLLYLATGWDRSTIRYVTTYYALTVESFRNERALMQINNAFSFVLKTGLSAETLGKLALPDSDFDHLNTTAEIVKNAVKAKYEEEDWLKLAGNLTDKIRENQKQALINYLLTNTNLVKWGARDADGLFEYFLIDVQMGTCMDTSRIVQANAAVQMFVSRCLLNLEKDISPDAIDRDSWDWMKNYRVWEANRKIFLYPENWLEPEWRDDRSPFFKELESELTQNDITDRSVETAFRNYLTKMDTVANLDVCGVYEEDFSLELKISTGLKMKKLHVFGRTHNAPYQFFYRTCDEFFKWTAWEKVQVDIRLTEEGDASGVHLVPVVWKNRLFIFWAEFIEKQGQPLNGSQTVRGAADNTIASLKPDKYWEMRLAWSENVDGRWAPKQLSKEFVKITAFDIKENRIGAVTLKTKISQENLIIYAINKPPAYSIHQSGYFKLSDIQSQIYSAQEGEMFVNNNAYMGQYIFDFEKFKSLGNQNLQSAGVTHLKTNVTHNIAFSNQYLSWEDDPDTQFFYSHVNRTYFVRHVQMKVENIVRKPSAHRYSSFSEISSSPTNNRNTGVYPGNTLKTNLSSNMTSKGNEKKSFSSNSDIHTSHYERRLEFHTFYHPFSSQFVTNLNQDGIKGLMDSDTKLTPSRGTYQYMYMDSGKIFKDTYDPDFRHIQRAPALDDYKAGEAYTYYKENICFDVYGTNSIYNWELFFHAPLYIATRLSKNGKYEEAMKWFHYIFDPTTDEMPLPRQTETSRYWKTLPFKTTPKQILEEWFMTLKPDSGQSSNPSSNESNIIAEWRKNPFKPFVVARNRPIAFMKNVVIKYVENLRAWGDSLFRAFTRESVNEALQIYVIANHILGPRPEFVPKRGEIKAETYASLNGKWDDFGNALVALENVFPNSSSSVSVSSNSTGPGLLGIGKALYFCIPSNEKLMEHWDTITDRLYKIRHCMDIDGMERHLALFSPPIDPAMLAGAKAQGISLGSILSDLSSPPPIYRFNYLLQKANEFCNDVKSLGSNLLSVLEKKDGEELGRLRAKHETAMLDLMTAIKERQVYDAKVYKKGIVNTRETTKLRLAHYNDLLSENNLLLSDPPAIDAEVNSETAVPDNTPVLMYQTAVKTSLVDSTDRGVKLIEQEKSELDLSGSVPDNQFASMQADILAGFLGLIPQFDAKLSPLGVGAGTGFGGRELSWFASSVGKMFSTQASISSAMASQSAKMASYVRREQEWVLQANLAAREIIQLDKQIVSADIKIQVSQKELYNHKQQIENSKEIDQYLKNKFTNQELYQWMKEQLFSVYKQSYNMAYDLAKKAELCYRFELANPVTGFIQYGYWDNTMQGFCAGEKLQLALRQMEKSYIEENKRELELTKSVSMALLNPLALQELRSTGKCFLTVPEELYDLDYQGHYFRRIKSVSLSLPCIAGPYTTVNCTLRLLKNAVRINTSMNDESENYEHANEEGIWTDDARFRESNVPVKAISTSTGQRDSGLFELSFRDERYLPFEGAGAISEWKIELTRDIDLRQFDYTTISDVILHVSYTAREDAGLFKEKAVAYLKNFLTNVSATQPLMRMFSMKHDFSTEWYKFLHPPVAGSDQILSLTLRKEHFPFFTKDRGIQVDKIDVLMKANRTGDYKMKFNANGNPISTATEISMPESITYANMQKATLDSNAGVASINVYQPLTFSFKHVSDSDFHSIDTNPDEISDLFVVFYYSL